MTKISNVHYREDFSHIARFWLTDFGTSDLSLGVHICWDGRVDLHLGKYMLSFGKVPIYWYRKHGSVDNGPISVLYEEQIAYANSCHNSIKNRKALYRAGVPVPKHFKE